MRIVRAELRSAIAGRPGSFVAVKPIRLRVGGRRSSRFRLDFGSAPPLATADSSWLAAGSRIRPVGEVIRVIEDVPGISIVSVVNGCVNRRSKKCLRSCPVGGIGKPVEERFEAIAQVKCGL